jgi:hypothetical protein
MSDHVNKTEHERWRAAFEMIGPETLRLRLEHRRNEYSGEYGRCAEMWLLEKDAESATTERERFRTIRRWTIIAGLSGIIAAIVGSISAWPIIERWIR